jgi:hypothetical protein
MSIGLLRTILFSGEPGVSPMPPQPNSSYEPTNKSKQYKSHMKYLTFATNLQIAT